MSASEVNSIQATRNCIQGRWTEQDTSFDVVAPFNYELLCRVIEASTEILVLPNADLSEPIAYINAYEFGLNCRIFTGSLDTAWFAIRQIQCDGMTNNSIATFRPDQLFYEDISNSGLRREGPGCSVLDITDQKLAVFAA